MPEDSIAVEVNRTQHPALCYLGGSWDSTKGTSYNLPRDASLHEVYCPLGDFKSHAAIRLQDANLQYPERAAWPLSWKARVSMESMVPKPAIEARPSGVGSRYACENRYITTFSSSTTPWCGRYPAIPGALEVSLSPVPSFSMFLASEVGLIPRLSKSGEIGRVVEVIQFPQNYGFLGGATSFAINAFKPSGEPI